jgi:hypothetical protein
MNACKKIGIILIAIGALILISRVGIELAIIAHQYDFVLSTPLGDFFTDDAVVAIGVVFLGFGCFLLIKCREENSQQQKKKKRQKKQKK